MLWSSNILFQLQTRIWKHKHVYNNGDTARINRCAQWEAQNRMLPSVIEEQWRIIPWGRKDTKQRKHIPTTLQQDLEPDSVFMRQSRLANTIIFRLEMTLWSWKAKPVGSAQPPKSYMMIHKHRLTPTLLRSEMTCNYQVWLEYEEIRRTSG
jgi:hypothetical protein